MWPEWHQPPKYVTIAIVRGIGWQIQAGHLVVRTGLGAVETRDWLAIHGYVRVATSTYERVAPHAA